MFRYIINRFRLLKNKYQYKNILHSQLTNYRLVDKMAIIKNSKLCGNIKVGQNTIIDKVEIIGDAEIGRNTTINGPNTDIYSEFFPVIIGNFCSISRNVSIQEYNHRNNHCTTYCILHHIFGEEWRNEMVSKGPIVIGNDVWIGSHVAVLPGAEVSNGAIIAANSVVKTKIPPYAIVGVGAAKIIKYRFDEKVIEKLLQIKWWEWSIDKIKRNKQLFDGPLTIDTLNTIID